MKYILLCCALPVLIHICYIYTSEPKSQPNMEYAYIRIMLLKEEKPARKEFLDKEIERRLKEAFLRNGHNSFCEMLKGGHKEDTLLRLFQEACQGAERDLRAAETREKAIEAGKNYNW